MSLRLGAGFDFSRGARNAVAVLIDQVVQVIRPAELLLHLDQAARVGEGGLRTVTDTQLLRRVVPQPLHDRLWEAGYAGMHALSFALRHRLSYLALLSHLACIPEGRDELLRLSLPPDADPEADLLTVAAFPWQEGVPILGFAASGAHLMVAQAGLCRAFDVYEAQLCLTAAEGEIFCAAHAAEAWWRAAPGDAATTQAKMCAFYFDRLRFEEYDEATLESLVSGFLRRIDDAVFTEAELARALAQFGFTASEEVRQRGQVELRRRFLQAAHEVHPDKGGETADFVALRRSYDVLRSLLG